jgi:predicted Zn finger-like uncharacterized protein
MRIACPNCAATYEVPDKLLAAGPRPLRCARCRHEWQATPADAAGGTAPEAAQPVPAGGPPPERFPPMPAPAAAPTAPEVVADEPPPQRPPPARGPRQHTPIDPLPAGEAEPGEDRARRIALAAWAASILLLLGLAAGAVVWRQQIMAAWPPSERVFVALGLA